jgi:hypothetical protein
LRSAPPEGKQEADAEPFYTVSVEAPVRVSNATFCFCQLSAGRQLEEVTLAEFRATYLFGFSSSDDLSAYPQFKTVLEHLVKSSVWLRFRDLFALTADQADLDFPKLPSVPDKIDFRTKRPPSKEPRHSDHPTTATK